MRALLAGLVLPSLVAVSGCGTVANSFAPRQYPHLYGGVEFDYLAMKCIWSPSWSDDPDGTRFEESLGGRLFFTALIGLDFPLSFVGDTITLPDVLMRSGFRGWDVEPGRVPAEPPSHLGPTDVLPTTGGHPEEDRK